MKQGVWITVVLILILLLGLETGYLLWGRREIKSSPNFSHKSIYRSPNPGVFASDPFNSRNFSDDWDPFQEMESMQKMMNQMFHDSFSRGIMQTGGLHSRLLSYNPDIDIKDTGKEYLIKLDLPGIDKDKVNVKVENSQLTISGERKMENEETEEGGNVYRSERSFGSFTRSIPLPSDADSNQMTANSQNGVLTIHIPKLAQTVSNTKKIVVT